MVHLAEIRNPAASNEANAGTTSQDKAMQIFLPKKMQLPPQEKFS
jgi:hypothetical protein